MVSKWYRGNAVEDGRAASGWLVDTSWIPAACDRTETWRSSGQSTRWGTRVRDGRTAGEQRTIMVILVDGRFRVDLTECSVTLAVQGDYLMWGQGLTTPGRRWSRTFPPR